MSSCRICNQLLDLARLRFRLECEDIVGVKSWCRVCGFEVRFEILRDYNYANRWAHQLDDSVMSHDEGDHSESGGWGWHWRLDEVLSTVFPNHVKDFFPYPEWYESHKSIERPVSLLGDLAGVKVEETGRIHRSRLSRDIDRCRLSKEAMLEREGEAWGPTELKDEFEVLGFRAPFAIVQRKDSGERGSLIFQNDPRVYFSFDTRREI